MKKIIDKEHYEDLIFAWDYETETQVDAYHAVIDGIFFDFGDVEKILRAYEVNDCELDTFNGMWIHDFEMFGLVEKDCYDDKIYNLTQKGIRIARIFKMFNKIDLECHGINHQFNMTKQDRNPFG